MFVFSSDTFLLLTIMTRSRNGSCNPSRGHGASPVHRGCDDRSPSPPTCTSHVRMQTPSAAVSRRAGAGKKFAATSDSPPHGRTMTRSASRGTCPAVSVTTFRRSDCLESLPIHLSGHSQSPYMGLYGGAPTAAGWGEDCWTEPPISSLSGRDPSH